MEDSEIAFSLQMEEALAASLTGGGASDDADYADAFGDNLAFVLQDDNLCNYEQELLDQYEAEATAKRIKRDLNLQIHDRAFACQLANMPEAEWSNTGDNFCMPYGMGSSQLPDGINSDFVVYAKGLVEHKRGGIGVAVCDGNGGLMFEVSKGLSGNDQRVTMEIVEVKALIEGLDVALLLGLNKINIVTDNPLMHQCITGENGPLLANVSALVDQMKLLLRKFKYFQTSLVEQNDVKFAPELARKAVSFQVQRSDNEIIGKMRTMTCTICMEDTFEDQMFVITGCLHSYCFPCMSKHIQVKLLIGILPKCPFENCKSELKLESCKKVLTPELFEIMRERLKEASIPTSDKIYCPYPKCSTLLSKSNLQVSGESSRKASKLANGAVTCPTCLGKFCIICKVPWHNNMSCIVYGIRNSGSSSGDGKLRSLANRNGWRACPKCNHMISLAQGCYHIYCRCGHEFCYTCGAEWRHKKPTCRCRIWDEHNIIHGEQPNGRA